MVREQYTKNIILIIFKLSRKCKNRELQMIIWKSTIIRFT